MKNISNKLTISRIILAFVFMFFLYLQGWLFNLIALLIFTAASITDFMDGSIARKRDEISEFGKFIDPIADKILVFAALIIFVDLNIIPGWMVILILTRDFLINGLRFLAAKKGITLSANQLARHKTFSQMLAVFFVLLALVVKNLLTEVYAVWSYQYDVYLRRSIFSIMLAVVIISLFSGIMYIKTNKDIFKG